MVKEKGKIKATKKNVEKIINIYSIINFEEIVWAMVKVNGKLLSFFVFHIFQSVPDLSLSPSMCVRVCIIYDSCEFFFFTLSQNILQYGGLFSSCQLKRIGEMDGVRKNGVQWRKWRQLRADGGVAEPEHGRAKLSLRTHSFVIIHIIVFV